MHMVFFWLLLASLSSCIPYRLLLLFKKKCIEELGKTTWQNMHGGITKQASQLVERTHFHIVFSLRQLISIQNKQLLNKMPFFF